VALGGGRLSYDRGAPVNQDLAPHPAPHTAPLLHQPSSEGTLGTHGIQGEGCRGSVLRGFGINYQSFCHAGHDPDPISPGAAAAPTVFRRHPRYPASERRGLEILPWQNAGMST